MAELPMTLEQFRTSLRLACAYDGSLEELFEAIRRDHTFAYFNRCHKCGKLGVDRGKHLDDAGSCCGNAAMFYRPNVLCDECWDED